VREHRLIAVLLAAISEYRAGTIGVEALRQHFSAAMSALEGDVPRAVRDAVRSAEADLESSKFCDLDVDAVLQKFEAIVLAEG